ncbi:MAG TPA: hypothetical protein VGF83_02915, partial [Actinomycetota bacterium]
MRESLDDGVTPEQDADRTGDEDAPFCCRIDGRAGGKGNGFAGKAELIRSFLLKSARCSLGVFARPSDRNIQANLHSPT